MYTIAKQRTLRTLIVIGGLALLFLLVVNLAWPSLFSAAVGLVGVCGGVIVLYEVWITRQIAQAEFIRGLNDSFTANENIDEVWRKLLLHEEVLESDRHRVSAYLTFFETVYVLLGRGVINFHLVDDLFRNRFFTAIGDPNVQRTALIRHRGSFENIFRLVQRWRDYLHERRVPLPPGYFSYMTAIEHSRGYEITDLDASDLAALLELQDRVIRSLEGSHHSWLRNNSSDMLLACLRKQQVVGARFGEELVAAAILVDAGISDENIQHYLTQDAQMLRDSCNLKLVLVSDEHQGQGLARTMVEILFSRALALSKREVLCTIHPENKPSRSLFLALGLKRKKRVMTPYGRRDVFSLSLHIPKKTRGKAVALPSDVTQVSIQVVGSSRVITPVGSSWDAWFDRGSRVSDDFLSDSDQGIADERESL